MADCTRPTPDATEAPGTGGGSSVGTETMWSDTVDGAETWTLHTEHPQVTSVTLVAAAGDLTVTISGGDAIVLAEGQSMSFSSESVLGGSIVVGIDVDEQLLAFGTEAA